MAIRGTLQEMSLGDLLQLLALGRKQGRLLLSGAGAEGVVSGSQVLRRMWRCICGRREKSVISLVRRCATP